MSERRPSRAVKNSETGVPTIEDRLLDTAERLIQSIPLETLTVRQIVAEAEVSRASFYFYFESKDAILTMLVVRAMRDLDERIRPHLAGEAPLTRSDVRDRVEAAAEAWREHGPVLRATAEHWRSIPELQKIWLETMAGLADRTAAEIVQSRSATGTGSAVNARQLAGVLVWSVERCLYVAGLDLLAALDPGEAVDAITAMWSGAVYPDPS